MEYKSLEIVMLLASINSL